MGILFEVLRILFGLTTGILLFTSIKEGHGYLYKLLKVTYRRKNASLYFYLTDLLKKTNQVKTIIFLFISLPTAQIFCDKGPQS